MSISVVIPVYNVEKYIEQCIDSILNQTLQSTEIILVDDGSTDRSGEICDEYAKHNSNVITIHKKNAGLGMARNTGLDYVTGEYVTFVDSDDFLEPDFLEKVYSIIEETGCDTCKTSYKRVDLEGKFVHNEVVIAGVFKDDLVRDELIPRLIGSAPDKKDSIPVSACCTVYSMIIIRKWNLYFVSEREWISEDIIFNLDYYSYSRGVALSEYIGYNYRMNINSLTTKYLSDRFERSIVMYNREIEILKEKQLYEKCKYRLIRQFFIYLKMCFLQLNKAVCGLSTKSIQLELKKMCSDKRVQEMVNIYPIGKLGIAQQLFVYIIQYQMIWLIYIFFILNWYPVLLRLKQSKCCRNIGERE